MALLRRALLGNGSFSSIAGLVAVLFAPDLADYMSISPVVLYVVGIGTAVFGVTILLESRRHTIREEFALFVIAADVSWVLGAIVVLVLPGSMANKWVLAVVSAVVALFAVLQSRGLIVGSRANPRRLTTEVDISASPEAVWAHLTDLESFAAWNPFMIEAEGEVAAGSRLRVHMQPPGGRAMTFTPTVTDVAAQSRFEWLGHLLVPGLFDGRHQFEIEATGTGTRLVHSEEFTGLLVPAMWKSLDGSTRDGFDAMNAALKDRAEVGPNV